MIRLEVNFEPSRLPNTQSTESRDVIKACTNKWCIIYIYLNNLRQKVFGHACCYCFSTTVQLGRIS